MHHHCAAVQKSFVSVTDELHELLIELEDNKNLQVKLMREGFK